MKTQSTITCPHCETKTLETMPLDSCQWFYTCPHCHKILSPKQGECCVFCSYGDTRCPSKQDDLDCGCT